MKNASSPASVLVEEKKDDGDSVMRLEEKKFCPEVACLRCAAFELEEAPRRKVNGVEADAWE